jgi:HD-GYP domain-containing protein (c-di-GMP phosphodiesterase class II)
VPVGRVRLAELSAAISLFTDIATGQPQEHALRTTVVAMRLADRLGWGRDDRVVGYYASLLRFLGCTATATETAQLGGGDDLAINAASAATVMQPGLEDLRVALRTVGAGEPWRARLGLLARMLTDVNGRERDLGAHCEVAARFGARMGLPAGVEAALGAAYARWDGRGVPSGLAGTDIPVGMRLAIVARDIDVLARLGGPADAERVLRHRRGGAYDPAVVDSALGGGVADLVPTDADAWELALDLEPGLARVADDAQYEAVLEACADFADLKFPHTAGHSRAVADLAAAAAAALGLPALAVADVRHAGLVHDLGRVGVPSGVWLRPGPLGTADWESVRLHSYYTQRILGRCGPLAGLGRLAGAHHERLDGSGYPAGARGLDTPIRILAAADTYQAMTQDRPHRRAYPPEAAARHLRREAEAGRLGHPEVEAVLAAAGQRGAVRLSRPAGLTAREVDVLRLLARGLSNREMAAALTISTKTVGRHVENLYAKIGVSSRAAAAVFGMEHDLLGH